MSRDRLVARCEVLNPRQDARLQCGVPHRVKGPEDAGPAVLVPWRHRRVTPIPAGASTAHTPQPSAILAR